MERSLRKKRFLRGRIVRLMVMIPQNCWRNQRRKKRSLKRLTSFVRASMIMIHRMMARQKYSVQVRMMRQQMCFVIHRQEMTEQRMYFGETMQTMRMQPTFCGWTMMTVMQPMYCVPTMTTVMQPMYYVQMMTRKVQAC